jgi:hypothetical protein
VNRPVPVAAAVSAAAVIAAALLAACGARSAAGPATGASSASGASRASGASPAAAAARLASSCDTGIYDESRHEFYAMASLIHGTGIAPGDHIAEAYKLTLTDTSAAVAEVAGFSVAFYSGSRKLTATSAALEVPAVLRAGQSRTLTAHPWGSSVAGHGASAGPFRAGEDGAVNTAATCKLVRLSYERGAADR